ncbi:MAG TPA: dihydrodipicolinate synthase family protein [Terriglobia bacterium]|nr:dihydrodipicolinate synthase family protein [Terriglobia bacterium]
MSTAPPIEPEVRSILQRGAVIPAHPLALNSRRKLDERRQRALTRYYCEAGAGGVGVGVHTTQFSIRDPKIGLLEPVLSLAVDTVRECENRLGKRLAKIAGVCGPTLQAVNEAQLARDLGYDAGLLSLGALRDASESALIDHCRAVAEIIPLFGFYLQPAAGGRPLDYRFWCRFLEIGNVVAIKVAPFNRYQTLDVVRALETSGRRADVSLYTGNDDNIVGDLMSEFRFRAPGGTTVIRFAGGLLGHWAVWTRRAVDLLEAVQRCRENGGEGALELLAQAAEITDANAALFDPANNFAGCIPGLHEILRRQGFLEGRWCLDPSEDLSPGQLEEIDRVCRLYPHLTDDSFVAGHLSRWLA